MVHNAMVARELSKLMLLSWNIEEQKGRPLNDMMTRVYPGITKYSLIRLKLMHQCRVTNYFIYMQLLHDVMTMQVVITKHANLSGTWESHVNEAKDYLPGRDCLLKEAAKRETKLEELVTLHDSQKDREPIIRVLEV